jgi:hypothetical protein
MVSRTSKPLSFSKRHVQSVVAVLGLSAACLSASPASAGPPFITDDPEPVDLGHWEVYGFSAGTHTQADTGGALGGMEVNYGAAPNLQLHLIVPLAFDEPKGGDLKTGLGDTEFGVKYRLVTPGKDDWFPQVGVFPLVEAPTGDAEQGLGAGATRVYLPVWLQKDVGKWTTYGGGGYWINPGPGARNYWFAGWLVQNQVTDNLALGVEAFHQTAQTLGGKESSGFNIGAIYDFNEHYHLLMSAGRGLQNAEATNAASYYVAIQHTF